MAKQSSAYFVVFALAICFLCSVMINTEARTVNNDERKWCIVKPSTPDDQLSRNADFVCRQQQHPVYNCTMIEQEGPCYNPTNKVSNASVVMHLYYHFFGAHPPNCDFSGSGITIDSDPSVGTCKYPLF